MIKYSASSLQWMDESNSASVPLHRVLNSPLATRGRRRNIGLRFMKMPKRQSSFHSPNSEQFPYAIKGSRRLRDSVDFGSNRMKAMLQRGHGHGNIYDSGKHRRCLENLVTSPCGKNLHDEKNVSGGELGFTTEEPGTYLACFKVDGNRREGESNALSIDWRIGIDVKDWEFIAKKENAEAIEIRSRKLEGFVETIHSNLLYFRAPGNGDG